MSSATSTRPGRATATLAGALGAIGAVFIIFAFRSGGLPTYVMPIVFGGAPVINVLTTMAIHPPKSAVNPLFFAGVLMAALGAGFASAEN